MASRTPVLHQGNLYPSFRALGRAFGLCGATAQQRVEKNIPLEKRISTPQESGQLAKKATYWGSKNDFLFIGRGQELA
jgi:hypothetical protein